MSKRHSEVLSETLRRSQAELCPRLRRGAQSSFAADALVSPPTHGMPNGCCRQCKTAEESSYLDLEW